MVYHSTAYETAQFEGNFPAGVERHYWFEARNAVLDRTLKQIERDGLIPAAAAILEVGCGTGVVVDGLLARGHDIRGVELGTPPRTLVPDRIHSGIKAQDLDPDYRYGVDALMFLDVIEHIPDDVSLLRETLDRFPNCRAVILTVPARPEVWSDHDRRYGHYRRYTRRSLASTMQAAGLEVRTARYMFRSLYVAAAMLKVAGLERNPVIRPPSRGALHRGLARILRAEDRILSGLPIPGLSVLAIGKVRRSG